MKKLFLALVCVFLAVPAFAQTTVTVISQPNPVFVWDQPVTEGDTVLPSAYTYIVKLNGNPITVAVTCTAPTTAGQPWVCKAPLPALPVGTHNLTVTGSITIDGTDYSAPSSEPLDVANVLIQIQTNLRIESGGTE